MIRCAWLNTSVQVQPASLDYLAGRFKWIQDTITDEPFHNVIAWWEHEPGEFDARDLVGILTCFNVDELPNSGDTQPVVAYEKESNALVLLLEKKPASCAMSRANVQNTRLCAAMQV